MAAKTMEKIERYKWSKLDKRSTDRMLNLADLEIDETYQRGEIVSLARSIARGFSWKAFGRLTVARRRDGRHFVVDGGQRMNGARLRGDIKRVPCSVFESSGAKEEAHWFKVLNENRARNTAMGRFKAAVVAGDEPEKSISAWTKRNKFLMGRRDNGRSITFPTALVRSWKIDEASCKKAILVGRSIVGDEPLDAHIFKALWYLQRGGVNIKEHTNKLAIMGGRTAILRAMKAYCIEVGQNMSTKPCAKALLKLINHKRRGKKRIVLES